MSDESGEVSAIINPPGLREPSFCINIWEWLDFTIGVVGSFRFSTGSLWGRGSVSCFTKLEVKIRWAGGSEFKKSSMTYKNRSMQCSKKNNAQNITFRWESTVLISKEVAGREETQALSMHTTDGIKMTHLPELLQTEAVPIKSDRLCLPLECNRMETKHKQTASWYLMHTYSWHVAEEHKAKWAPGYSINRYMPGTRFVNKHAHRWPGLCSDASHLTHCSQW